MEDIPLVDVIFFLMERTMRSAKEVTRKVFKEHQFDVTVDQWVMLKRISEKDGISQIDLANSTFKDPAAVTRMLDLLSRKGLVERRPKPDDRRVYEVYFTNTGRDLVEEMTPIVKGMRAGAFKDLSEEEMDTLKNSINKIYRNIGIQAKTLDIEQ